MVTAVDLDMSSLAFLRSLPKRLLERVRDGTRRNPGAARDEEAAAGPPAGECYACTQPGVPAFHSTTCDQVHSPDWDADAGSSLVPVQAQQTQPASSVAAHHADVAARWLFGPVLDPRSKRVQRWNRWILLGRAAALAADPLFFYALSVGRAGRPCMYMDAGLATAVTALRTFADVGHLGHVLLQFRLAYVSRESLVVGCGKLVWDARAIAAHYARSLKGLWFDLFVILPIPQVIFWLVIPKLIREEQVKLIMTILLLVFLFQYLPKVYHSIHIMRKMQKVTGYIFGTIWWGFGLNLFAYFAASHIAGGCWYVLAIQRIASCLEEECKMNNSCDLISLACSKEMCFNLPWSLNNDGLACNMTSFSPQNVSTCLSGSGSFAYGIYKGALPVISSNSLAVKILYPIFWGLMTLSTFGNDLEPTSNGLEVIFQTVAPRILQISPGDLLPIHSHQPPALPPSPAHPRAEAPRRAIPPGAHVLSPRALLRHPPHVLASAVARAGLPRLGCVSPRGRGRMMGFRTQMPWSSAPAEPPCDATAAVVAARRGMETPLTAVAEAFEELALGMAADGGELCLSPFGDTCALVSVLFSSLGMAFRFAEIEYVAKVNDLIGAAKSYRTLNDILDKDVENDCVKKQGSHSRNLRRVRLGLGLIKALFEQFLATEGSLYDAATTAYGQVCAPFHSWAIRKAVGAGMYTLPTREQLIERLNETDLSVQKEMRRYINASSPIIEYIDNLFLSRNIRLDW